MFKKSENHSQLDLFSSPTEYFKGSKKKKYLKNDSWHNRFREEVVMRVDESIFSPLYTHGNGAPNASIRVLVGMMPSFGGSFQNFLRACNALQIAHNKLIYNNFNAGI